MNLESPNDLVLQEDLDYIANSFPNEFDGKTILISGATGLIGSQFVKAILCKNRMKQKDKTKVIALVRNKEKVQEVYSDLLDREELIFVYADITQSINITEKIDYIIHGASITSSKIFVTKPVEVIETSILGTLNLLTLAKEKEVEGFVYLSSMEMYGVFDENQYADENTLGYIDILNVRSCYSEGKRMCENLCVSYAKEYNLPIKIARLSQTFGAGIAKNESRVFAQFARSVIENKDIVLHTRGESWGNYCYTADVIMGITTIMMKGEIGEAYNISNEETNMSIKDMAQLVATKIALGKIKVIIDIPENSKKLGYAPDTKLKLNANKLKNLGWEPRYNLIQMYERLIASINS